VPSRTELDHASPAWSLPTPAWVGAPSPVHISSCPQSAAPAPGRSSPAPLLLGARPRCPGGARPRRPLAEVARAALDGAEQRQPCLELARAGLGRSSLLRPHLVVSTVGLEAGVYSLPAAGLRSSLSRRLRSVRWT
jgi:hypothetical protein